MQFPCMAVPESPLSFEDTLSADVSKFTIETVELERTRFIVAGESFETWRARLQDAELLLRAKVIKCLGEDHIERAVREIRLKIHRRQMEYGML